MKGLDIYKTYIRPSELKTVLNRADFLKEHKNDKKTHTQRVIDKLDSDELTQAEDFDGEIGSYLSDKILHKIYPDFDEILDRLGTDGIYYDSGKCTYWQKRYDGGMVRIK